MPHEHISRRETSSSVAFDEQVVQIGTDVLWAQLIGCTPIERRHARDSRNKGKDYPHDAYTPAW